MSTVDPELPLVTSTPSLDRARQSDMVVCPSMRQVDDTVQKHVAATRDSGEQKEDKGGTPELITAPTTSPRRPLPVGMTRSSRNTVEHRERLLPMRRRRGWRSPE